MHCNMQYATNQCLVLKRLAMQAVLSLECAGLGRHGKHNMQQRFQTRHQEMTTATVATYLQV